MIVLSIIGYSQNTPVAVKKDTILSVDTVKASKHSPRKATLMSTFVPGLGQAYNKKYWKIPIIYTGFAVLGYFIITNGQNYNKYKNMYYAAMDTIQNIPNGRVIYSQNITNLISIKNYYRRNLELTCIFTGLLYIMNILDAAVDANLYDFDVSDNLAINIKPVNYVTPESFYYGLNLTLKFK